MMVLDVSTPFQSVLSSNEIENKEQEKLLIFLKRGKLTELLQHLETSLFSDPTAINVLTGLVYYSMQQYRKCAYKLFPCYRLEKLDSMSVTILVDSVIETKKYRLATILLSNVDTTNEWHRFFLAKIAHRKGNFASSNKLLQSLVNEGFDSTEIYNTLGRNAFALNKAQESKLYFQSASRLSEKKRLETVKEIAGLCFKHHLNQANHNLKQNNIEAYNIPAIQILASNRVGFSDSDGYQKFIDQISYNEEVSTVPSLLRKDLQLETPLKHNQNFTQINNQIVVVDRLLTDEALQLLLQELKERTIWHMDYSSNGYVGTALGNGLESNLFLQLAQEIKTCFSNIIKDDPLTHLWAFKQESPKGRVHLHSDFAKVSLNLWLTPDGFNLNKKSGGLIYYDYITPPTLDFGDYNSFTLPLEERVKSVSKYHCEYKFNRAVLFNSSIVHESDAPLFEDSYDGRRINLTFLFGRR